MLTRTVLLFSCLVLVGCQKLNDQRTIKLDPGDSSMVTIDPATRQQEVTVDFSAGEPVDVYLFLEKDKAAVERSVTAGKVHESVLKHASSSKQGTLTTTVPAKESLVIMIQSKERGTEVKLSTKGK